MGSVVTLIQAPLSVLPHRAGTNFTPWCDEAMAYRNPTQHFWPSLTFAGTGDQSGIAYITALRANRHTMGPTVYSNHFQINTAWLNINSKKAATEVDGLGNVMVVQKLEHIRKAKTGSVHECIKYCTKDESHFFETMRCSIKLCLC